MQKLTQRHAMEMLLTGDMTPADRAAEIALVNRRVVSEALTDEVMAVAREIASKFSTTLATGKRTFHAQAPMPLARAYGDATKVMVDKKLARDAEEGKGALSEKRAPNWQDM